MHTYFRAFENCLRFARPAEAVQRPDNGAYYCKFGHFINCRPILNNSWISFGNLWGPKGAIFQSRGFSGHPWCPGTLPDHSGIRFSNLMPSSWRVLPFLTAPGCSLRVLVVPGCSWLLLYSCIFGTSKTE